ncbi:hypothetical protein JHK87_004228 [Glycine soja]|nr:hypothetical protein JHK87_004228 [Glycine soja]
MLGHLCGGGTGAAERVLPMVRGGQVQGGLGYIASVQGVRGSQSGRQWRVLVRGYFGKCGLWRLYQECYGTGFILLAATTRIYSTFRLERSTAA